MSVDIDALSAEIRKLEQKLEAEFARRRAGLRFGLERGRVVFEQEVVRRHKQMRTHVARYIFGARLATILTAPVIYSLIIPIALLDLWVSLYQAICFRAYRIPQVKRGRYMIFDRAALGYLNAIEKLNCAYCSYANGVFAYAREVGSRTEQYWCPIKHAKRAYGAHPRYAAFEDYGDGAVYREHLMAQRAAVRASAEED